MNLFIFDPSLGDNAGTPPTNLGDIIIRRSLDEVVDEIFPDAVITRASSHVFPSTPLLEQALAADLVLVAGTNLLSSHVLEYDQWKLSDNLQRYAEPPNLKAVLLGVGWWQYQDDPDNTTRHYYRRLLHSKLPHSVRDVYTQTKLATCGLDNIINTTCPTLWKLDGLSTRRKTRNRSCLFCLTDYKPAPEIDDQLIRLLLSHYEELIFFPQGDHDLTYAATIPAFAEGKTAQRIVALPHDIEIFYKTARQNDLDYVGTRLHAGAWCLEHGLPSLILAVDNRSQEIGKDINLPVVTRDDTRAINAWLNRGPPDKPISLPLAEITAWKKKIKDIS